MSTQSPARRTSPRVGSGIVSRLMDRRVVLLAGVAAGTLLWLIMDALTPSKIGPIPVWPFWVTAILALVIPTFGREERPVINQVTTAIGVILSLVVMVRTVSFRPDDWTETSWIHEAARSIIFRESDARVPVIITVLVTLGVWAWGARYSDLSTEGLRFQLQVGLVLLFIFGAIGAYTGGASETGITAAGAGYFACMLLAIGWARDAAVHPGERSGGARITLWTSIGGVVVIILVTLLLASVVNPAAWHALLVILSPVFWVIRMVIIGIAWVLLIMMYPIFWLLSQLNSTSSDVTPTPDTNATPFAFPRQQLQQASDVPSLPDNLRTILASILLVAAVVLLARYLVRRHVERPPEENIEQRIEFDWRSLLPRRRAARPRERDPLDALRRDQRYRNTVIVRERYADFLRRAARAGQPRRRPETVRDHAGRVAAEHPGARHDLAVMVDTYAEARYDAPPLTDDERERFLLAWSRVEPTLGQPAGG